MLGLRVEEFDVVPLHFVQDPIVALVARVGGQDVENRRQRQAGEVGPYGLPFLGAGDLLLCGVDLLPRGQRRRAEFSAL